MIRSNEVTLFSNGIGHFRRTYLIPSGKEETFSIPFKRDHIGDVAASLQVFGKVRINRPPSFTPSNANATALKIDPNDALKSMLRNLSGSSVKINDPINPLGQKSYILLGIDSEIKDEIVNYYIVLMCDGSVKRVNFSNISYVHFEEESVRTEIEKALKNNFQLIKPDSTLLDLSLSAIGDSETEATVQYTIPVAAWKMRYAIRQEGDSFSLEGAAIIDNNTDEDWGNFKVSVVTGNPISFNTDIATVCVPQRKTINLIETDNAVYGGSSEDKPVKYSNENLVLRACSARSADLGPKMSSYANYSQFGMSNEAVGDTMADIAESAGVESKEVGDFCVFTSKEPITILARKSAVVPMFAVPLNKAGVVLLYKESNNARRPYRAIKFKNETDFSLGKGKTVIYNSGVFSGECVLETTKPDENRMLPHCLENGVKITKSSKDINVRRQSLKISDSVCVTEELHTAEAEYTIENKKNEVFKVVIEHLNTLPNHQDVSVDFSGVVLKEKEKLSTNDGYRAYFELQPKQTLVLIAKESAIVSQKISIGASGTHGNWLKANVSEIEQLKGNKQIISIIRLQTAIDEANAKLDEANENKEELTEQSERVRRNLEAAKNIASEHTNNWVNDLDKIEQKIRDIDSKSIPSIKKNIKEAKDSLSEELKKLSVSWNVKQAN